MPQIGEIRRGYELGHKSNPYHTYIWHACVDCGRERWVAWYSGKPRTEFCASCASRRGALKRYQVTSRHPRWKGGRRINPGGYIMIKLSPNDFFFPMAQSNRYVLEHRLIMAKYLGRFLLPWEVVHHKNGLKTDNRLENLELLPARRYHIVDSITKKRLGVLEKLVQKQANQIKLLQWHIKELEQEHYNAEHQRTRQ